MTEDSRSNRETEDDAGLEELVSRLNSAVTHLMRHIRKVDESQQIGRARLSALAVLHFGGPSTLSALAAAEWVSAATMHHIIKGLESDGFVRRRADRSDRRKVHVALTAKGRRRIVAAHRDRLVFLRTLLHQTAGVGETELATTVDLIERLNQSALSD